MPHTAQDYTVMFDGSFEKVGSAETELFVQVSTSGNTFTNKVMELLLVLTKYSLNLIRQIT